MHGECVMSKEIKIIQSEGKYFNLNIKGFELFLSEAEFNMLVDTLIRQRSTQEEWERLSTEVKEANGGSSLVMLRVDDLPSLSELEKRYIQLLLDKFKEKGQVADILKVDRTTLYRKLKDYSNSDEN